MTRVGSQRHRKKRLSSLLTALSMSYVNPFTDHAVYVPLRLFTEYGLR